MSGHTWSYLRTSIAALLAALSGSTLLAWMPRQTGAGLSRPATVWIRGVADLALVVAVACMFLVAFGGVVAARRAGLEARGVPYARRRPREWAPGAVVRTVYQAALWVLCVLSERSRRLGVLPGEPVDVRSLDDIMATLDADGKLEGLPFMPEMVPFCGRRFRVLRRVEKVYDYVTASGLRRMRDTVLLEGLRCRGDDHGGCQVNCHLLWKEDWLRRADRPATAQAVAGGSAHRAAAGREGPPHLALLRRVARRVVHGDGEGYACQMTELRQASTPMAWKDPRHYLRDLCLGNVRPGAFVVGVALKMFNRAQHLLRRPGYPDIATTGLSASPHVVLDLRPGEMVRVKPKREIEQTLTAGHRNRGLWFDRELLRFCGGEYRVAARVDRLIEEKSGRLITLTTPCIILDGVTASGEYLAFYPQNESILWREIWLERVRDRTDRACAGAQDRARAVARS